MAVLSGMLLNASSASAAEIDATDKVAAIVERIVGDGAKIQLQPERRSGRDGDEANQPLRVFQQLYAGDRIDVQDPNGAVVISLVGAGERRTLTHGESPFRVPEPEPSPTLWGNLGQEVVKMSMKFISSLSSEKQARKENTIAAISRGGETGGELRAPVFQFGAQRVVAGERTFMLAWEGGEPPYAVDIKREGNAQPLARVEDLSSPEVPPTYVRLQPGRHSIIIRDRDHAHTVRLAFDAVEASREPSPGNPSPFSGLPREVGTNPFGRLAGSSGRRCLVSGERSTGGWSGTQRLPAGDPVAGSAVVRRRSSRTPDNYAVMLHPGLVKRSGPHLTTAEGWETRTERGLR